MQAAYCNICGYPEYELLCLMSHTYHDVHMASPKWNNLEEQFWKTISKSSWEGGTFTAVEHLSFTFCFYLWQIAFGLNLILRPGFSLSELSRLQPISLCFEWTHNFFPASGRGNLLQSANRVRGVGYTCIFAFIWEEIKVHDQLQFSKKISACVHSR